MDYGIVRAEINKVKVEGRIWQDPYGPTNTYFLSLPHVQNGIPQCCSRADYDCIRVLAGQLKLDCLSVPVLSNVQFGIQVLGFEMPWAWNKYLENRAKNDKKYKKYVRKMAKSFFNNFLVRSGLS